MVHARSDDNVAGLMITRSLIPRLIPRVLQRTRAPSAVALALFTVYLLRPLRDDLAVSAGVQNLAWLFTATLLVSLLGMGAYLWAANRWPSDRVQRISLLATAALPALAAGVLGREPAHIETAAGFVLLSVGPFFLLTLLWSSLGEYLRGDTGADSPSGLAARVGPWGVAAAVGGLAGAALLAAPWWRADPLLILVGAALIQGLIVLLLWPQPAADPSVDVDGKRWHWQTAFRGRAGQLNIQLLGQALLATFLYVMLLAVVEQTGMSCAHRVQWFARIDLAVLLAGLVLPWLLLRSSIAAFACRYAFHISPAAAVLGLLLLGLAPGLYLAAGSVVAFRATQFLFARLGREQVYRQLTAGHRRQGRMLSDVLVRRFGDLLAIWLITALAATGFSPAALALTGGLCGLMCLWTARHLDGAIQRARQSKGASS